MRFLSYILAIILVFFGLTFALLNAGPVSLNYYIGIRSISLSLLLILTVGLGVLIGFIFALGPILRLRNQNRQQRARIKQLENEVLTYRVPESKGLE